MVQVEGRVQGHRTRSGATRIGALAALAVGACTLWTSAAAAQACAPWPGEPSPLPRVDDRDEMLRRWAQLRVQELERAALELEGEAPLRANHLWRRVLCLDAASDAAVAGLARTPLLSIHQPALVTRATDDESGDAWSSLDDPLRVSWPTRAPAPPPEEPATPAVAATGPDFDALVGSLEQQVRSAQFEEALASVDAARSAADAPAESARVEVLAATAALALGRGEEADAHLGRALRADPDLTLDPMSTPPKVQRALDRVRAEQSQ